MSRKATHVPRKETNIPTNLADTFEADWLQTQPRLNELAPPRAGQPPPRASSGLHDPSPEVQLGPRSRREPMGSKDRPILLLDSSPEPITTTAVEVNDSDGPRLQRRKRKRGTRKMQTDLSLDGLFSQHEEERRRVLDELNKIIQEVEQKADKIIGTFRPNELTPYMPHIPQPRLVELRPGRDPADDPIFAPRTDAREDYQQVAWFGHHNATFLWSRLKIILRNLPDDKDLHAHVMRRAFAAFANRLRRHLIENPDILRQIADEQANFGTYFD